jgi:hypothetical protein
MRWSNDEEAMIVYLVLTKNQEVYGVMQLRLRIQNELLVHIYSYTIRDKPIIPKKPKK